ncbi:MAG: nucleotidyltransferase domain-containing protein [Candidatus Zixiibacteriota bacterium]
MHDKSPNSVKVSYLKGSEVLSQLSQAAKRLKENSNVFKVYLFGSFVKGDYRPGSDADVSIVLKHDKRRIIDRIPEYLDYFSEVTVPVDVFPYTVDEVEAMKKSSNPLWREIMASGVEL